MMSGVAPWKIIALIGLLGLNTSLVVGVGSTVFSDRTLRPKRLDWLAPISVSGKNLPEAKPIASYPLTLTHPVFFKTRAPFVAPPPPVPAPVRPPPLIMADPGLVLGGIMIIQGTRKAYLFRKTESVGVWVGAEDGFLEWRIQSIDAAGIVLHNGDRVLDLKLYTER